MRRTPFSEIIRVPNLLQNSLSKGAVGVSELIGRYTLTPGQNDVCERTIAYAPTSRLHSADGVVAQRGLPYGSYTKVRFLGLGSEFRCTPKLPLFGCRIPQDCLIEFGVALGLHFESILLYGTASAVDRYLLSPITVLQ